MLLNVTISTANDLAVKLLTDVVYMISMLTATTDNNKNNSKKATLKK